MLEVTGDATNSMRLEAASSFHAIATLSVLNVSVNNSAHLDSKSAIDIYLGVCVGPTTCPFKPPEYGVGFILQKVRCSWM